MIDGEKLLFIFKFFVIVILGLVNFENRAGADTGATGAEIEMIKVSGVVKDDDGELPGVHVRLMSNAGVGDVTDIDGRFELQVPKGDTLVVSYVGYESQNLTELHEDMVIELKQGIVLDEVVVRADKICSISNVPYSAAVKKEKDPNTRECVAISCVDGYEVQNGECVEKIVLPRKEEKPEPEQEPETEQAPVPEVVPSPEELAELRDNYDNMKEIENSFENRMLGATGMATMGIGGMQLATAMTEDRADDAAEQQMKAYLATFSCTYADGKRFSGGETAIELPGGNELINLYSEYVGLANNLKTRKEALGLRAGIEAQPILDSATSGLYDDISTGKTSGAFTSLARALSDPNGADAAAWAAQRAETAEQKKTALTTLGIGAVATVAGNILINRNNEKERSAEIQKKYDETTAGITDILTKDGHPDIVEKIKSWFKKIGKNK